jgi:ribonucleoside-diphosphate reductase alpha chain
MSQAITQIKKRNGSLVDFRLDKIETAVKKAFLSVLHEDKSDIAKHISELVLKELELEMMTQKDYVPTVEHLQDIVEKNIARAGFFDVAKHYIIYRYEHTKIRQEVVAEKIEKHELLITKKSGAGEPYSENKLKKYLDHHSVALQSVDMELILKQMKMEIFSGMTTEEIRKALIMVVRSFVERDHDYSLLASRLLRSQIYEEVLGGEGYALAASTNNKID